MEKTVKLEEFYEKNNEFEEICLDSPASMILKNLRSEDEN
jgi:hypothetical protein